MLIRLYQTRHDGISSTFLQGVCQQLKHEDLNDTEHNNNTKSMLESAIFAMKLCVLDNLQTEQQVAQKLYFADFTQIDAGLKQYLAQVIAANVGIWSEQASDSQICLPKFVDLKWRVDIKSASHVISHMQQPCVMVALETQAPSEKKGQMKASETVHFELNKETLEVMLKGLGKIRDQLSGIK